MSEAELRASVSRVMRGLNHDLKNPLGAADGYLDLLLQGFRGELSSEQRQTLERVRALIASGVSILEDVVAYTRASIGELRTHPTETDVPALVRMTMQRHEARAANAGIALEFRTAEGTQSARAVTDGDLVAQVVDRLLANALDHTPDGGRVEVVVSGDAGGVDVSVSDTGPGVRAEDRERVFLAFERGPAPARGRETAGIGFGLALAKSLTERLHGELQLEESAGTGARFRLRIPKQLEVDAV